MSSLLDFAQQYPTIVGRLHQARLNHRVGQAYLFIGDDIAFLERFAMAWAQTAACLTPHPDGSACGHCPRCDEFQRNVYPECIVVRPVSKSRQIRMEDMSAFEHSLSLTVRDGYLKIGLILEAERLNASSQNSFLKTLEEPPPNTMLLLLTTNARMLLPTTKSRCQTISLLRNRQDYSNLATMGLFHYLSMLHRQAGASQGITAAAGISAIFASLRDRASASVDDSEVRRWAEAADATMKKQAEEEQKAKIEGEYVRLRAQVTDAILAWFLQRLLIASGTPQDSLPNPEMLREISLPKCLPEEASADIRSVEEFLKCLASNVDEKLALDAMCLTISRKR